jgi:hypothetical protein
MLENAQEWYDWGTKWGVPNLLPPEEMHVTVLVPSSSSVRSPAEERAGDQHQTYGARCFAMFGPNEDHLVFNFSLLGALRPLLGPAATSRRAPTWSPLPAAPDARLDAAGYDLPLRRCRTSPATSCWARRSPPLKAKDEVEIVRPRR